MNDVSDPILQAVEDAEVVVTLLDGLVDRTRDDPRAPFAPDVVAELVALKSIDRGAFEQLRAELKSAGCRVTALDESMGGSGGGRGPGRPTQADALIAIADSAFLFHAPDGIAYADIQVEGHRETWPVRTRGFRRWLTRRYFDECGGAPGSEAIQSAIGVIEAKAHYGGQEMKVHLRVGEQGGRFYLDLADSTWQAIEIDANGWRLLDCPPVRFRRSAGMQSLPVPMSGGSIETLRGFLNVQSDTDFVLVVSWILACLRNTGPYPVLVVSGEQGSAKSTFSAMVRSLVDPNTAPLRALPREDRDLFIAANNGHVLAFDNVSSLSPWLSDTLCRLATGGGFAVRQLYTDQDEVLFDASRPIILNGIEDIVTRQDLADRGIFLNLAPIPDDRRRPEAELWAAFHAARPRLLGVLLDAILVGLRLVSSIQLDGFPRMADFALWSTACETALWPPGTFRSAYQGNRDDAVDNVIDSDPVAAAVRILMSRKSVWEGTATQLHGVLAEIVGDGARAKTWPDDGRLLSGRLRRAAPFLRRAGIGIEFERRGRSRAKIITLTLISGDAPSPRQEEEGKPSSASSASSADNPQAQESAGSEAARVRTMNPSADDGHRPQHTFIVRGAVPETANVDGADDADDEIPTHSMPATNADEGWEETL